MSEAARLYTPELLGLAVELAQWPARPDAMHHGAARAAACGSTIDMDLDLDDQGRVASLGLRVRACAVGQAAAAIFARHAIGRDPADLQSALAGMEEWLAGGDLAPEWPGLDMIAPARHFPGRHGAMLLPWRAALAALSV
ncbi:iron-sulfur cluster assembly scaffold protein [Altererythrobacter xixiisoli]|uniref:Iron-sulfur cluster assembly scaffold protein n=1 Tax=Croceibacterium xixiisoli TaxID=1476466 RepID=A0A6I4TVL9_9SPHN|nr:iron-sulfur cluster assembly scaffold protein [Croceibacterium xixiisoli]MXP00015.1 iron-sulfur cluster assembly scaffold protein [Croceibacterium xixiisoli]